MVKCQLPCSYRLIATWVVSDHYKLTTVVGSLESSRTAPTGDLSAAPVSDVRDDRAPNIGTKHLHTSVVLASQTWNCQHILLSNADTGSRSWIVTSHLRWNQRQICRPSGYDPMMCHTTMHCSDPHMC